MSRSLVLGLVLSASYYLSFSVALYYLYVHVLYSLPDLWAEAKAKAKHHRQNDETVHAFSIMYVHINSSMF